MKKEDYLFITGLQKSILQLKVLDSSLKLADTSLHKNLNEIEIDLKQIGKWSPHSKFKLAENFQLVLENAIQQSPLFLQLVNGQSIRFNKKLLFLPYTFQLMKTIDEHWKFFLYGKTKIIPFKKKGTFKTVKIVFIFSFVDGSYCWNKKVELMVNIKNFFSSTLKECWFSQSAAQFSSAINIIEPISIYQNSKGRLSFNLSSPLALFDLHELTNNQAVLSKISFINLALLLLSPWHGLLSLHQLGGIHQDLSLKNLLIFTHKDGFYEMRLTDFGNAVLVKDKNKDFAKSSVMCMTPEMYIAYQNVQKSFPKIASRSDFKIHYNYHFIEHIDLNKLAKQIATLNADTLKPDLFPNASNDVWCLAYRSKSILKAAQGCASLSTEQNFFLQEVDTILDEIIFAKSRSDRPTSEQTLKNLRQLLLKNDQNLDCSSIHSIATSRGYFESKTYSPIKLTTPKNEELTALVAKKPEDISQEISQLSDFKFETDIEKFAPSTLDHLLMNHPNFPLIRLEEKTSSKNTLIHFLYQLQNHLFTQTQKSFAALINEKKFLLFLIIQKQCTPKICNEYFQFIRLNFASIISTCDNLTKQYFLDILIKSGDHSGVVDFLSEISIDRNHFLEIIPQINELDSTTAIPGSDKTLIYLLANIFLNFWENILKSSISYYGGSLPNLYQDHTAYTSKLDRVLLKQLTPLEFENFFKKITLANLFTYFISNLNDYANSKVEEQKTNGSHDLYSRPFKLDAFNKSTKHKRTLDLATLMKSSIKKQNYKDVCDFIKENKGVFGFGVFGNGRLKKQITEIESALNSYRV